MRATTNQSRVGVFCSASTAVTGNSSAPHFFVSIFFSSHLRPLPQRAHEFFSSSSAETKLSRVLPVSVPASRPPLCCRRQISGSRVPFSLIRPGIRRRRSSVSETESSISQSSSMEQRAVEMDKCQGRDAFSASRASGARLSMESSINVGITRTFRTFSGSTSHGRFAATITNESRLDSFGRISSRGLRWRGSYSLPRNLGDRVLESISLSRELAGQILGDVDSSMVARTGDSGDWTVVSGLEDNYENEDLRISTCEVHNFENGFKPSLDDVFISPDGILSQPSDAKFSLANPLKEFSSSPLPADLMLHSTDKDNMQNLHSTSRKDKLDRLPRRLDYVSYLIHLAVFGIFGVLTRYLLQKLFGPDLLALTRDYTPLYLDLLSNMLGSFLMGWIGIVFKTDLHYVSEHLVIGLTTGYMGSLTTFSGWNQKMLDLTAKGQWTFAVAGIVLGMLIVNECVNIGVESAAWLRECFMGWIEKCSTRTKSRLEHFRVHTFKRQMSAMIIMLIIWGLLWGLSGALARTKLDNLDNNAFLWLGCLVGPPGVWARWYLARLNGQGLGKMESLKWLPIGTLLANFLAACLMAALSTISKAVNTKRCGILVSGVQFGFLGCMSTVSTFVAEVYAMRQSGHPGRALAYALLTILPSFVTGILIYSVPVWTKHYN